MNTHTEQHKPLENEQDRMVPLPSHSIVPQRDVDKAPILETHHLGIDFGGLTAVEELTIAIGRTEISGLIGPNGAGKTTVFNLLTNVYHPTRGDIILDGKTTARKSVAVSYTHLDVYKRQIHSHPWYLGSIFFHVTNKQKSTAFRCIFW